jgi:site-specific DNA recombinase
LVERLLHPERLAVMLSSLKTRRAEKAKRENQRVMALQREMTDAEDRLKRLYRLVEDGMTDLDDVLKERLDRLKADRDCAKSALDAAKSQHGAAIRIDPALIKSFGRAMRENLTTGSTPFRKAYLRSLIDVIEVDDTQIRIKGSKEVLERAVLASRSAAQPRSQMSTKWRTRHDSNVWPSPSEGDALSS